jgi:hypothetical protein
MPLSTIYNNEVRVIVFNAIFNNMLKVALNTITLTSLCYIVESGIKHHNSNPIVLYCSSGIKHYNPNLIYHNEVRVMVFNVTFYNISQWG